MSIPLAFATNGFFGGGGGSGGVTYRMRAKDTSLNEIVYWTVENSIDTAGAQYTGPGPLEDIVVACILGTAD